MNPTPVIRSGSSLGRNWAHINNTGAATNFRGGEMIGLVGHDPRASGNGRTRRSISASGQFPFRIYQLPSWYRSAPNPSTDWLKVCVRAGYYGNTLVTGGTDGEQWGYDETFPTTAGAGVNEVALTSGVAQTWFYLTTTGTPTVSYGTSVPGGALTLGYVDTTNTAQSIAHIRQIQYGDLESYTGQQTYGPYANGNTYYPGSIVYITTTASVGGITVQPGTYLCLGFVGAGGTGNLVPQWPLPLSGTVYWMLLAFGPSSVNICTSSGNQQVYLNATAAF